MAPAAHVTDVVLNNGVNEFYDRVQHYQPLQPLPDQQEIDQKGQEYADILQSLERIFPSARVFYLKPTGRDVMGPLTKLYRSTLRQLHQGHRVQRIELALMTSATHCWEDALHWSSHGRRVVESALLGKIPYLT